MICMFAAETFEYSCFFKAEKLDYVFFVVDMETENKLCRENRSIGFRASPLLLSY